MRLFSRKPTDFTSGSLTREAWRKFSGNRLSLAALLFIVMVIVIAIAGYLVTPDPTPMANRQVLEIAAKKPG